MPRITSREAAVLGTNARSSHANRPRSAGRREDLDGRFFRSLWEANYARYLKFLLDNGQIEKWEYEVHTFTFEGISRGCRTYTPDFKLTHRDGAVEWHEVKGWLDQKSRTRLERMKRYFPEEKVIVIDTEWFRQASRSGLSGVISGWEDGRRR